MSNTFIDQIPTLYFFTNLHSTLILGFFNNLPIGLKSVRNEKTQFKAALRSLLKYTLLLLSLLFFMFKDHP
jgi:hypothetical protein